MLERPGNPEHGDYATNVALRIAPERGRPPRELAEELAAKAAALPGVERAEVAGPGFVNLFLEPAWFGEALAEALEAGRSATAREAPIPRSGSRSRWSPRTRPGRSRSPLPATAPTATRSRACSRSPATRSSASTTTTTPGAQMDRFRASVEARRRGEEPPEDGYMGAYVDELRGRAGRPGAADARVDRGDARALPHPLRHLGAAERGRAGDPGGARADRDLRGRRGGLGADVEATATTRTAS